MTTLVIKKIPRYTSHKMLKDAISRSFQINMKYMRLIYQKGMRNAILKIRNQDELFEEIIQESIGEITSMHYGHSMPDNMYCQQCSEKLGIDMASEPSSLIIDRYTADTAMWSARKSRTRELMELLMIDDDPVGCVECKSGNRMVEEITRFLCQYDVRIHDNLLSFVLTYDRQKSETGHQAAIDDIRDVVCPLWKYSYEKQLEIKLDDFNRFLRANGLPSCSSICSSDNKYRNSFEFVFGFTAENRPCLGFRGQSFACNRNLCFDCRDVGFIGNIKDEICHINEMIRDSGWMVYDRETEQGFLRMMKVKVVDGECLVLIDMFGNQNDGHPDSNNGECSTCTYRHEDAQSHPGCSEEKQADKCTSNHEDTQSHPDCSEEKQADKCMCDHNEEYSPCTCNLKDLQSHLGSSDDQTEQLFNFLHNLPFSNVSVTFNTDKFEGMVNSRIFIIKGKTSLVQPIEQFQFRISYFTFFQANIEILVKIVDQIRKIKGLNQYLLDICCGSLVFGTMLSNEYTRVIGIEKNSDCLKDFQFNRDANKLSNCQVMEMDINRISMGDLIRNITNDCQTGPVHAHRQQHTFTAILDPPRAGVSKSLVKRIRRCTSIREVFYISCDYKLSLGNIKDFLRKESNAYVSRFEMANVYAFDMFVGSGRIEALYHLKRTKY